MSFIQGSDEDLRVTARHDIYPTIDPQAHYAAQTFKGKVVLITGASRGIGLETALQYARAGASLTLVARKQETLDASRDAILRELPNTSVLTFPADVRDTERAGEAVSATVSRFGRLDIVVANAALIRAMDKPFASKDPLTWWDVVEVNVRGVYNYAHFSVPELLKTKGSIVIVTALGAQYRIPFASEYCTSKHAVDRFAEFITLEYPEIKVFPIHPGVIETQLNGEAQSGMENVDSVSLPAATILYVTSGKADYLSGRYISAPWDLGEVEKNWKDKIVSQNALVSKLALPQ
ncbi:NAD-P-binding protein [Gloeopeniophorella convolvens]|nr:NAD-P-binding protein [Gloeopeniophorella convolvens]